MIGLQVSQVSLSSLTLNQQILLHGFYTHAGTHPAVTYPFAHPFEYYYIKDKHALSIFNFILTSFYKSNTLKENLNGAGKNSSYITTHQLTLVFSLEDHSHRRRLLWGGTARACAPPIIETCLWFHELLTPFAPTPSILDAPKYFSS